MAERFTGTKRGRMTLAEEDLAAELFERGLTVGRIAQRMDRHPSTINWTLQRLGLKLPMMRKSRPYVRNGVLVVPFACEEDVFLMAARAAGHPFPLLSEIWQKRYGHHRSQHTLRMRAVQLANLAEVQP